MAAGDYIGGSGGGSLSGTAARKRRARKQAEARAAKLAASLGIGTGTVNPNPFGTRPYVYGQPSLTGAGGETMPRPISGTTTPAQAMMNQFSSAQTPSANITSTANVPGLGGHATTIGTDGGSLPMDQWSGFAGNYTGLGLPILYDNPEVIARDAMKSFGYNTKDGLLSLAEDQGKYIQFLAMLGMGTGAENGVTPENYLNFAQDYFKQLTTPGAGAPDVWGMVQSILDAPGGSALEAYLTDGTPQEQASALNDLVATATMSLPPVFRKAIMGKLEDDTNDWLSSKAKGKKSILADFLQQGGGGLLG